MSATEKLAAASGNRTFYFYIVAQTENEIRITMYNTPYTLVRQADGWQNHAGNYFAMAPHLIEAVISAAAQHQHP